MSDYPSYWTDTLVLKAIHYALLPLVGVARVIQRLGGRIAVGNVYAGPDGARRYTVVGRVNLRELARRFCDHDWFARTADDDIACTWFDEFSGMRHEIDVCKTCGTERSRETEEYTPSKEARALLGDALGGQQAEPFKGELQ